MILPDFSNTKQTYFRFINWIYLILNQQPCISYQLFFLLSAILYSFSIIYIKKNFIYQFEKKNPHKSTQNDSASQNDIKRKNQP